MIQVTGLLPEFTDNGHYPKPAYIDSFRPGGGRAVAGQVLEISKHDNAARAPQEPGTGRTARIYRFPASKVAIPAPPPELPAPRRRKSHFRLHLMIEITLGLMLWLAWFIWHLVR